MPNRASLLTGRYPSVHGLRYNGCTLPLRANTFVDVLAAGGYKTAAIGKSHLQPFTGMTPPHRENDVPVGAIGEAWQPENGDYTLEEPPHYDNTGHFHFPTPYYGFEHVDMVTGHGVSCHGHYRQWLQNQRDDWEALTYPCNQYPHDYTCPQANRTRLPEALYPTFYIRDKAIEYLQTNL